MDTRSVRSEGPGEYRFKNLIQRPEQLVPSAEKDSEAVDDTLDAAGLRQVVEDWVVNETEIDSARLKAEEALRQKAFAQTEPESEALTTEPSSLESYNLELKEREKELSAMPGWNIFGRLKLGAKIKGLKRKIAGQTISSAVSALREKK